MVVKYPVRIIGTSLWRCTFCEGWAEIVLGMKPNDAWIVTVCGRIVDQIPRCEITYYIDGLPEFAVQDRAVQDRIGIKIRFPIREGLTIQDFGVE
jgi:hypothetical protein